jgi:hypothetical protein
VFEQFGFFDSIPVYSGEKASIIHKASAYAKGDDWSVLYDERTKKFHGCKKGHLGLFRPIADGGLFQNLLLIAAEDNGTVATVKRSCDAPDVELPSKHSANTFFANNGGKWYAIPDENSDGWFLVDILGDSIDIDE